MSLWSRDCLRIGLAPGEAALVRHRGKSRNSKTLSSGSRDWHSLMPLLEHELADPAWQTSRAEVVLSGQYVRLALTPAPGKPLSRQEEEGLARASFRQIYGEETAGWRVRVHSQPPRFGLVGAAIDEALAVKLEALLTQAGIKHIHVNPLVTMTSPRRAASGWQVVAEHGWLCLLLGDNGAWRHLGCHPAGSDWRESLPGLLEREAVMAGQMPGEMAGPIKVHVHAVGVNAGSMPPSSRWQWHLHQHGGSSQGAMALAMSQS